MSTSDNQPKANSDQTRKKNTSKPKPNNPRKTGGGKPSA